MNKTTSKHWLDSFSDPVLFEDSRYKYLFLLFGIGIIGIIYYLIFGNYRLEAIDDAWSLSFAWNFMKGVAFDPVFRLDETQIIFGKTYALFYGPILDMIGWTRGNAHLISTAFTLGGVFTWCLILRHLEWDKRDIGIFAFLALMLEPFLGAANLTRPEALCFLLLSTSLLCFMKKHFFISVLFACFAFETHAMGILSFFYFLSWALVSFSREDWEKAVLWGVPAVALGIAYFFWINDTSLSYLMETMHTGRQFAPNIFGTFSEYFIHRSYHRHVPELVLLLLAGALFLRNRLYHSNRFLAAAFVVTFIASIIIKRSDYIYVIYYFPLFIMMMITVAKHYRKTIWLAVLFSLLLIPQYSFLWFQQGGFDFDEYVAKIRRTLPQDNLPIIGSSNNWFAFMETRRFHDYGTSSKIIEQYNNVYVIEGNFIPYNTNNRVERSLAVLNETYKRKTEIGTFLHFGTEFMVYRLDRE